MIRRVSLLLAAVSFVLASPAALAGAPKPEPVTVAKIVQSRPAAVTTTTLRINVASGGCTQASDFKLTVTQRATDQVLHFDRLKQDFCEMDAPEGTTVELTTTDVVPGKPIVVDNPLFVGTT